jgi:SAM-dependent methyltransferase
VAGGRAGVSVDSRTLGEYKMKPDDLVGDYKYYSALVSRARQGYNHDYAVGYRESDNRGFGTRYHLDFEELLGEVTSVGEASLAILDVGCGTGRYWHALHHLRSLTGVDLSFDMLQQAKTPVCVEKITMPVSLIQSTILDLPFRPQTFDLVYSIGVLGDTFRFDRYVCERLRSLVKPGGRLVLTVKDCRSPSSTSWKRELALRFLPFMPRPIRRAMSVRLHHRLCVSEAELRWILDGFPWSQYTITERKVEAHCRKYWICIATKEHEPA